MDTIIIMITFFAAHSARKRVTKCNVDVHDHAGRAMCGLALSKGGEEVERQRFRKEVDGPDWCSLYFGPNHAELCNLCGRRKQNFNGAET